MAICGCFMDQNGRKLNKVSFESVLAPPHLQALVSHEPGDCTTWLLDIKLTSFEHILRSYHQIVFFVPTIRLVVWSLVNCQKR